MKPFKIFGVKKGPGFLNQVHYITFVELLLPGLWVAGKSFWDLLSEFRRAFEGK